jgi:hypothetical protein
MKSWNNFRNTTKIKSGIFLTGLFCVSLILTSAQVASAADSTTLAISIRTLSNPYQANYKVVAEGYGKQVGLDVLTTEANSQKGLTEIKSEVARTGGNVVLFIDPNQSTTGTDGIPEIFDAIKSGRTSISTTRRPTILAISTGSGRWLSPEANESQDDN